MSSSTCTVLLESNSLLVVMETRLEILCIMFEGLHPLLKVPFFSWVKGVWILCSRAFCARRSKQNLRKRRIPIFNLQNYPYSFCNAAPWNIWLVPINFECLTQACLSLTRMCCLCHVLILNSFAMLHAWGFNIVTLLFVIDSSMCRKQALSI